jgi:predicted DCC family thiol-disulfide oxidoreductase YuxK
MAAATGRDRGAHGSPVPVRRLTVLYDPHCSLCAFGRDWLARQRQLVPVDLVAVGSPEAHRRFPQLDHDASFREVTAVGDSGQVYRGATAWIVCLWALAEYRPLSHRLATGAGKHLARGAVLAAAKYRAALGEAPCSDGCSVPH